LPLTDAGEGADHHGDRLFEAIEKRPEAVTRMAATRLALPILNQAISTMMPICHDGMQGGIGDSKVIAPWIGAVAARTVNLFAPSPTSLHRRPREWRGARQQMQTFPQGERRIGRTTRGTHVRCAGLGRPGRWGSGRTGNGGAGNQDRPQAMQLPDRQNQT
jgi:hypothetical protein